MKDEWAQSVVGDDHHKESKSPPKKKQQKTLSYCCCSKNKNSSMPHQTSSFPLPSKSSRPKKGIVFRILPFNGPSFVGLRTSWAHYCWWKKSCTTWDVKNPVNNGMFTISTGAGFLPSTVWITQIHRFSAKSQNLKMPPELTVAGRTTLTPQQRRLGPKKRVVENWYDVFYLVTFSLLPGIILATNWVFSA